VPVSQYGQLKRELAKFAPWAKKYIVMHDTTVDATGGEAVRERKEEERLRGHNAQTCWSTRCPSAHFPCLLA
jgi:hypothetical protein